MDLNLDVVQLGRGSAMKLAGLHGACLWATAERFRQRDRSSSNTRDAETFEPLGGQEWSVHLQDKIANGPNYLTGELLRNTKIPALYTLPPHRVLRSEPPRSVYGHSTVPWPLRRARRRMQGLLKIATTLPTVAWSECVTFLSSLSGRRVGTHSVFGACPPE